MTLTNAEFHDSLVRAVNDTRDEFRARLIASFASYDPTSPERYVLVWGGGVASHSRGPALADAFTVVAQAGRWTVLQAPDLRKTGVLEDDLPYCRIADLGPVGEGLPPAAWAVFAASSPQAGNSVAAQHALVDALRAACAH